MLSGAECWLTTGSWRGWQNGERRIGTGRHDNQPPSNLPPAQVLDAAADSGQVVEMENLFSRLTLDIIGKAVFDYDFDSLTHDDPVIQVGMLTGSGAVLAASGLQWRQQRQ